MGLGYKHKTNNINLIVKRSHKQTVNRAKHDQRVGKCYTQQHFIAEPVYFCCVPDKQDAQQAGPELWLYEWTGKH